jgi:CheY-like chemotaxis protein
VNITTAENGKQALDVMNKTTDFDLVLLDMMMPEMDGYDMLKEIRSIDKWKDLPVIAVTAKIMQGEKEKCFEAGVSDYLSKPIKGDQLISLLKIWLYK